MKDIFDTIFSRDNVDMSLAGRLPTAMICLFFALVSVILTILNFVKSYIFMAETTLILVAGFLVATALCLIGKGLVARYIIGVLCGVVFSVYAVMGGNDGFAILWILLIPLVADMLVGLRIGFLLSLYFQVFLVILFYTPLSAYVQEFYTPTFIMRFPLLYLASFGSITLLMCQRQKLYNKVNRQAYYDALTNLHNRRRYEEIRAEQQTAEKTASVLSFDLNRLKYVNDNIGHQAGDEILQGAAELIRNAFSQDECFRTGGDEFAVISYRSAAQIRRSEDVFRDSMKKWKGSFVESLNVSMGTAISEEHPDMSFEDLCQLADQDMYAEKARYYRENGFDRRRR